MNTQMYETPQPATERAYEQFQRTHPGRGALRVQVSTARGFFPVAGALVTVSKTFDGAERVLYKSMTDTSGIVEHMVLPALPVDYSQQQSTAADSGTLYQVSVYHPAFTPEERRTVEIYAGIETILPVALEPVTR